MNIAYKIFHLNRDSQRNGLFSEASRSVSLFAEELKTETYEISSEKDYIDFIKNNPDFNLDKNGYNLDNIQGWKWGEVGIWASNWKAWKNFLNSDYDILILMEDDIIIQDGFKDSLFEYLNELPKDWQIFHYYVFPTNYHRYSEEKNISKNLSLVYQDNSCLCYIINKNGAKKLLSKSSDGIYLPLDWFMFRQRDSFFQYTTKPDSDIFCANAPGDSTFQLKEGRNVINAIL